MRVHKVYQASDKVRLGLTWKGACYVYEGCSKHFEGSDDSSRMFEVWIIDPFLSYN
jgi:hypothetical protein